MMNTITRHYRVDKARIGFIRFIFEAHEGIAVVSTKDPKAGIIKLAIAPDRISSATKIVDDLKKDFMFDEV